VKKEKNRTLRKVFAIPTKDLPQKWIKDFELKELFCTVELWDTKSPAKHLREIMKGKEIKL
jgi:hypothetical protein